MRQVWTIEAGAEGSRPSAPGDSGAMWLEHSTRRAVGLHFAGDAAPRRALAMAIGPVLDALAVDLAPTYVAGDLQRRASPSSTPGRAEPWPSSRPATGGTRTSR